jgi:hypothetical protein
MRQKSEEKQNYIKNFIIANTIQEIVKIYALSQFIGRLLKFVFVSRHLGNANFLKPSKN